MYAEDISVFFRPDAPGVVAAVINGATVYGSLESEYGETLETGPIRSDTPTLLCERAKLPAVAVGDAVTVGAVVYRLRELEASNFDPLAILHLNNT